MSNESDNQTNVKELENIKELRAYLAAAIFADLPEEYAGEVDSDQIDVDSVDKASADVNAFLEKFGQRLAPLPDRTFQDGTYTSEQSAAQDLWFSRQGHGVGFWEKDRQEYYGAELAQEMDEYSKSIGPIHLEVVKYIIME